MVGLLILDSGLDGQGLQTCGAGVGWSHGARSSRGHRGLQACWKDGGAQRGLKACAEDKLGGWRADIVGMRA